MDGNSRFELGLASPDSSLTGNYQNGQRGYSTPSLGRSSSFRENADGRNFVSAKANFRGNASSSGDLPSLSQYLTLDPIPMGGDHKNVRTGELMRLLGVSVGSSSEESAFGAAHLKNTPPVTVEELKRLRSSFADSCIKASGRGKKLDEHINNLNKLFEVLPSKKQQRGDILANERSSGSTLKIGSLSHRNVSEAGNMKVEDRHKNGALNKRLRTSVAVADTRSDSRSNGVVRQQMATAKEKEMAKDSNADSELIEEKIRRLPAGGESWDKKMKRKRSVGAAFPRSVDNEVELKRNMHQKLTLESSLQSGESTQSFRYGTAGGSNKLDPASSPVASTARAHMKTDQEKYVPTRDIPVAPVKERVLGKVNVRMGNRDENLVCPSPIVKGKASRTPRSGSIAQASNSPANISRATGTPESWEQTQGANKNSSVGGANNRKRSMLVGSPSPPITQWGGQRPQKISRTRRTNLVPVSNNEEMQMPGEACSPSEFGPRLSISGLNASLTPNNAVSESHNFKIKSENVPSPMRFSESEESGALENRTNDKSFSSRDDKERSLSLGHGFGPSMIPTKKNKMMVKEQRGDIVRKQGLGARTSSFSKPSGSPAREAMDNTMLNKPLHNDKSSSEKNGSKSGRPLKRIKDRKISRNSHLAHGGSPRFSGESDDDHEELLTAANLACSSSVDACLSPFWKTFESLFAPIGPEEKSFLSQQNDYVHGEIEGSGSLSSLANGNTKDDSEAKAPSDGTEILKQLQIYSPYGSSGEKSFNVVTPLYQRVLSALILEEEIEDSEESAFGSRDLIDDSCVFIDTGSTDMSRLDMYEPVFGVQTRKNDKPNVIFPFNGNGHMDRHWSPAAQDRSCNGEVLHNRDGRYGRSEVDVLVRLSRQDHPENGEISYSDSHYDELCLEEKLVLELQSVGLFLEAVPALNDKEDAVITQEMAQLKMEINEKIASKRKCLNKIHKAIQEGKDIERNLEQVAMDKLVELAYMKFPLQETRGNYASKNTKGSMSKQVALGFAKRTLARCRKFEVTGVSCFSEPALREIIYAPPPRFAETDLLYDGSAESYENDHTVKSGPPFNRCGGAKGKRSDLGRNSIPKSGRLSLGSSKAERKTKSNNPKHKNSQLSTPINTKLLTSDGPNVSGELANNSSGIKRKDVRFMSSTNNNSNSSAVAPQESVDFGALNDLDGIDELGAPQDLNSWLNIDVDGIQDYDSVGLEIPMDDISDLNMF